MQKKKLIIGISRGCLGLTEPPELVVLVEVVDAEREAVLVGARHHAGLALQAG